MLVLGETLQFQASLAKTIQVINPLSPNNDQQQFSPNNIHTLSRDKVMRINKMIIIEKIPWSFIKFSQLILKGDVWRSVWRICVWILGLKRLTRVLVRLSSLSQLKGLKMIASLLYNIVTLSNIGLVSFSFLQTRCRKNTPLFKKKFGIIGMYSVDLGAVVCVFVSWVWWEGAELHNYSMVLV